MSRSRRGLTMENEEIDRWIILAGFVTLAVVLIIECAALYLVLDVPAHFRPPEMAWPETIMRLFFGQSR